jgi:hypothetical protein
MQVRRPASAHRVPPDRPRQRPTSARRAAGSHDADDVARAARLPHAPRGPPPPEDAQDERADGTWLQYKMEMSGRPCPEEGLLTVVVEYCWNSESRQPAAGADAEETAPQRRQRRQLSTQHSEERYHEEALLVKAIIEAHYPDAHVFLISIDFRAPIVRPHALRVVPLVGQEEVVNPSMHARQARLGAFEVDARYCTAGEVVDVSLWSKLATQRWISWPGWQERARAQRSARAAQPRGLIRARRPRAPAGHAARGAARLPPAAAAVPDPP